VHIYFQGNFILIYHFKDHPNRYFKLCNFQFAKLMVYMSVAILTAKTIQFTFSINNR